MAGRTQGAGFQAGRPPSFLPHGAPSISTPVMACQTDVFRPPAALHKRLPGCSTERKGKDVTWDEHSVAACERERWPPTAGPLWLGRHRP